VACWSFTSFIAARYFGRYRRHSGHWLLEEKR
jgi:hypothetical protein